MTKCLNSGSPERLGGSDPLATGGWLWNSHCTIADGCSSARFCAPSRRIAEMNAAGLRVSVERKAIGAPLVRARHGVGQRQHHQRHGAGREQQQRQPGDVGDAAQRERRRPSALSTRARQVEAGQDQHALERRCPSRCRRARGGASSCASTTSISSSEYSASIVSDTRMRRVAPMPGQRRVGLLRLLAQAPLVGAQHAGARAFGEADSRVRSDSRSSGLTA